MLRRLWFRVYDLGSENFFGLEASEFEDLGLWVQGLRLGVQAI